MDVVHRTEAGDGRVTQAARGRRPLPRPMRFGGLIGRLAEEVPRAGPAGWGAIQESRLVPGC